MEYTRSHIFLRSIQGVLVGGKGVSVRRRWVSVGEAEVEDRDGIVVTVTIAPPLFIE
jgi:hypothetical protein